MPKSSQVSTEAVLQHHLRVLGAGDVDATLSDYAPNAFIITSDSIVRGHDEIRAFFMKSVTSVLPPGSDFTMLSQTIEEEIAHIVWQADTPFFSIPLGTDTFVVRDGKIVSQTFTGMLKPKPGPT